MDLDYSQVVTCVLFCLLRPLLAAGGNASVPDSDQPDQGPDRVAGLQSPAPLGPLALMDPPERTRGVGGSGTEAADQLKTSVRILRSQNEL